MGQKLLQRCEIYPFTFHLSQFYVNFPFPGISRFIHIWSNKGFRERKMGEGLMIVSSFTCSITVLTLAPRPQIIARDKRAESVAADQTGRIVIGLYGKEAPESVEVFLQLIKGTLVAPCMDEEDAGYRWNELYPPVGKGRLCRLSCRKGRLCRLSCRRGAFTQF